MLQTLHISNYALIDTVDIDFHPGFNVITGETGAGKSIILGALSLILGERADTRVVRNHQAKSVIEATFTVDNYTALKQYCLQADIEWDETTCILRREISPNGRSRAFVNDSPVPLGKLQNVAIHLIDIHSQHQNQLLTQPTFQLQIIDTLASNQERLQRYTVRYNSLRETLRALKTAKTHLARERDDQEYTRFQLEQLDQLALQPGEQDDLERRQNILTNLTQVKSALADALAALADAPANAIDLINTAKSQCETIENALEDASDIPPRLESAKIEIDDIADTLRHIDENLTADSSELEYIDQRLNTIYSLCRKHHLDHGDQLIDLRHQLRDRLNAIENSGQTIADLERQTRRALALARESATEISQARKTEAEKFSQLLQQIAIPLGMKNLQCQIAVEPADMSATGIDKVKFLFAFNKNQTLMPVESTASGGEISRLMLSIKSIIASKMQLPSIIFDEIDTGVSGDVADRMGRMMRQISKSLQVTTITHLPQVASKGDNHYRVYKEDDEHQTHTRIRLLTQSERESAIAAMLSGSEIDNAALENARSLLSNKE